MKFSINHEAFPAEIYPEILKYMDQLDYTTKTSKGILSMALSSRIHFALTSQWADKTVSKDIQLLSELEELGEIPRSDPPRTGLSILCKRLGGICALCNLRQGEKNELFTDLQLCHSCDLLYFPKISRRRMENSFAHVLPRVLEYQGTPLRYITLRTPKCDCDELRLYSSRVKVYRWQDIQNLINDGMERRTWDYLGKTDPEEYGLFGYRRGFQGKSKKQVIWERACRRWDPKMCGHKIQFVRPHVRDMILLNEFRWHFDPLWEPRGTTQESDLQAYIKIAGHWMTSNKAWESRPWAIQNFPPATRGVGRASEASDEERKKSLRKLEEYKVLAEKIRGLCKVFPNILRDPFEWKLCMDTPLREDYLRLAMMLAHLWKEPQVLRLLVFLEADPDGERVNLVQSRVCSSMVDQIEVDGDTFRVICLRSVYVRSIQRRLGRRST
jgi:hypothetical protein